MWIARGVEPKLKGLSRSFPAVLLTGARQTGKTSLLRHAFPKAEYVSLDLPSIASQAESDPEEFLGRWKGPVVLDEVQYAPALFRSLKAAIDRNRHAMGRYLMTGSQKFVLMKELPESLAGRCALLELDTLSAAEVQGLSSGKPPSLLHFLWRGGFPELYRNRRLKPADFFSAYVAAYLERDVRALLRVGNLRDFERFLRACALRSGQLLNLTDLARDIGIAGTTARDWISVLEASNQLALLEPYHGSYGKRLIKTPKLYFLDTGLLCFLLGLDSPEGIQRSLFTGALWETFALNQIWRARMASGSAAQIYFWRDARGKEVDFVIEHQGRLRLVEAKWAEEVNDSRVFEAMDAVRSLLGKRAAAEHWVVCRTPNDHLLPGRPGIRVINGYRFLNWF